MDGELSAARGDDTGRRAERRELDVHGGALRGLQDRSDGHVDAGVAVAAPVAGGEVPAAGRTRGCTEGIADRTEPIAGGRGPLTAEPRRRPGWVADLRHG